MRRCIPALVLIALSAACSDLGESPVAPLSDANARIDPTPGPTTQDVRYIVVLNTPSGPTVTTSVVSSLGVTPDFVYEHAITGFVATLTPAQVQALQSDPQVAWVEEDQPVSIGTTQTPTPSWGLDRTDQMNLPLDNSFTYNATGAGVTFYSVDTGVRSTHSDFGGRVSGGFTSIFDGLGTEDCHGHGTHTTSTAAGVTYGIAKAMSIVPVRVLNCSGSGFTSGVIAGVDWIRNNATLPRRSRT